MTKKIRVTIDLDDADNTFNRCYGEATDYNGYAEVNYEGACVYWYGSPHYWIEFKDVEVIKDE